jgi:hypothetical protein
MSIDIESSRHDPVLRIDQMIYRLDLLMQGVAEVIRLIKVLVVMQFLVIVFAAAHFLYVFLGPWK